MPGEYDAGIQPSKRKYRDSGLTVHSKLTEYSLYDQAESLNEVSLSYLAKALKLSRMGTPCLASRMEGSSDCVHRPEPYGMKIIDKMVEVQQQALSSPVILSWKRPSLYITSKEQIDVQPRCQRFSG